MPPSGCPPIYNSRLPVLAYVWTGYGYCAQKKKKHLSHAIQSAYARSYSHFTTAPNINSHLRSWNYLLSVRRGVRAMHDMTSWHISDRRSVLRVWHRPHLDVRIQFHYFRVASWQASTYEVILGVYNALAPYRPSWLLTTERTSRHVGNFTPANVLIVWM